MSQSTETVKGNGHHPLTLEDDPVAAESTFFDPTNPEFASPRQPEKKKRGWKRKVFTWSLVLFLIAGGIGALYLALKARPVNVRVQADSRRDLASAKPEASPGTAENGLSAEAINIAREAIGNDTTRSGANPSASPSASPGASPDPTVTRYDGRNLSFTVGSPAYLQTNASENPSKEESKQQTNVESMRSGSAPVSVAQSHANPVQTLFVEDVAAKPLASLVSQNVRANRIERKPSASETAKPPVAVVPPFGTLLPVRSQGVIFTLRNNSYARLELTRDTAGDGWSLPKGTLLVGRVSGSEQDRAFINVIGYIDPRENRLVKMSGEVLGADGATGLPGKRISVDRAGLRQTLRKVASGGLQVASAMAGALTGRGTVVIDGYRLASPISDEANQVLNGGRSKQSFVKVEAGRSAFVMVADLPKELHAVDAPGDLQSATDAGQDGLNRGALPLVNSLSDREVMELILFGAPEEIRAALPMMNDEQRRLALKSLPFEKRD
jgi:hypothetical protein